MDFALIACLIMSAIMSALWLLLYQTDATLIAVYDITSSALLPPAALLLVRSTCAVTAVFTLYTLYRHAPSWEFRYHNAVVLLRHHTRFTTFTTWCFTLLGSYFTLATACSVIFLAGYATYIPAWLASMTLVLFEVSYPMSFLVTSVVTFVLIPTARRHQHPTARMFRWRPLMMHSGNVLMMQAAMLSAPPPVTLAHLPYAVLFGCGYAIFSWYWFWKTGVFYYFFLDYRRPKALWIYVGLLVTIILFYVLSYGIALLVHDADSRWWAYPGLVLLTLSLTRFRAPKEASQPSLQHSPA